MKHRLDVKLDFTTDLSALEFASTGTPLVQEAVEAVLGVELEFDIFRVLDRCEVRFVMEWV